MCARASSNPSLWNLQNQWPVSWIINKISTCSFKPLQFTPYITIPIVPYPTYHGAWLRKITITVTQRSISVHTVWFQDLLGQGNPCWWNGRFLVSGPKIQDSAKLLLGWPSRTFHVSTRDRFDLDDLRVKVDSFAFGHFFFVEFRRNGKPMCRRRPCWDPYSSLCVGGVLGHRTDR